MVSITQPETKVLFEEKRKEGKSIENSNREIKRDKEFEKNLSNWNNQIKYLQRIIEKKDLQIKNLNEKLKKKVKERFDKKLKEIKLGRVRKNYEGNVASTRELWRIISYLEHYGKTNLSKLSKECVLVPPIMKNALSFLLKTNIITQLNEGRIIFFVRR